MTHATPFLERLRSPEPLLTVELRPPRADLDHDQSMDVWMGIHSTVRQILARDAALFVTDGAVGTREEENLHHLVTNLEDDISRARVCPFLTTKHTLEYCVWYAARALEAGCPALTVLGGDTSVGAPRCVPHGYMLRQHLRQRFPALALGGWANPHRDAAEQAGFLEDPALTADFYLTQVVSHHDLPAVEAFLTEVRRRGLELPAVFGVFFYRSANRQTLERLSRFIPVPEQGIADDFASGLSAVEICARTVRALRDLGADKVYISNLHPDLAGEQLEAISRLAGPG
ncbi:MAG: hypothetical protein H6744_05275 [Deltaproteobacteria bacterium]|nr:hypothetical protein [Deltaproteobacteria bacterium]MCB9786089.1 hypothetical protein [Deltaproteobacteria bacterium]